MSKAIIFDLDGTIANHTHRLHLVKQRPRQWQRFFDLCFKDTPNEVVVSLIKAMQFHHASWHAKRDFEEPPCVVIVSGRPDSHREVSEQWLERVGIGGHPLLMRTAGDCRPDTVVKAELLDVVINNLGYQVIGAVDDRPSVIRMWKACGIPVLEINSQDWDDDEAEQECYEK